MQILCKIKSNFSAKWTLSFFQVVNVEKENQDETMKHDAHTDITEGQTDLKVKISI